ncbi:MAG: HAD-IA family hydrolase [Deltaproteobacteria bacterium]|nr:HAD-IA family hydrolase [Deltaproteobacteria bacterium]
MSKIKGILFDLDNTLIDFMKMKRMACSEAASAMIGAGLKMEFETLEKELFGFYLNYGIEGDYPFTDFLKKHNAYTDAILASAINAYHRVKSAFLEPYPGVIPMFVKLIKQGIKLGIVTDAPSLKAHQRIDAMKLHGFFDVVVTEAKKPDSQGFLKAVEKFGLKPQEVMMVGDWPEKDMVGAKKAGLIACFAKYGHSVGVETATEPDHTIHKIEELLEIL